MLHCHSKLRELVVHHRNWLDCLRQRRRRRRLLSNGMPSQVPSSTLLFQVARVCPTTVVGPPYSIHIHSYSSFYSFQINGAKGLVAWVWKYVTPILSAECHLSRIVRKWFLVFCPTYPILLPCHVIYFSNHAPYLNLNLLHRYPCHTKYR